MFEKVSCSKVFPILSPSLASSSPSSSSAAAVSTATQRQIHRNVWLSDILNRHFAYWARCRNSMPCHQVWVVSSHWYECPTCRNIVWCKGWAVDLCFVWHHCMLYYSVESFAFEIGCTEHDACWESKIPRAPVRYWRTTTWLSELRVPIPRVYCICFWGSLDWNITAAAIELCNLQESVLENNA